MTRGILSVATALPRARIAAQELTARYAVDPGFVAKLGIIEKPVALQDDEHPSDLCTRAARRALSAMGASVDDVGLIVSAGVSADYLPSWCNAVEVVGKLGARRAVGFDLQLGCAAVVASLAVLRDRAGGGPPLALVVSAERWAHTLSPSVPFPPALLAHADGGAACVVGDGAALQLGPHVMKIEPAFNSYLITPAGGTREPTSATTVNALRHFRTAPSHAEGGGTLVDRYVRNYREVIGELMTLIPEEQRAIQLLVMNQVRPVMRRGVAEAMSLGPSQTVSSYERFGHLGGADSFVGLEVAERQGKLRPGTVVLAASSLPAFGAMALFHDVTGARLAVSPESDAAIFAS